MTGVLAAPPTDGAVLFACFAYPPNALGYCGPGDTQALLEQGSLGVNPRALRELAGGFEGAWPYLQLIAGAAGLDDPLDQRVVEAYWIGNPLLAKVTPGLLAASLDDRFRRMLGPGWNRLVEGVGAGAVPHHNFHVFSVYPWVGLLRNGHRDEPLRILDRCRIRWGTVLEVDGDTLVVSSRPLVWRDQRLELGVARPEPVTWRLGGHRFLTAPLPGDHIAMHWDWACARLDARRLHELRRHTLTQLDVANGVPHPPPAAVLA